MMNVDNVLNNEREVVKYIKKRREQLGFWCDKVHITDRVIARKFYLILLGMDIVLHIVKTEYLDVYTFTIQFDSAQRML